MTSNSGQPHLLLKNDITIENSYSSPSRFQPNQNDDEPIQKNYSFQKQNFKAYLSEFINTQKNRHAQRDISLNIPNYIDFIEIHFFKPFEGNLENLFINSYGLYPSKYSFFNKKVLFAINDTNRFDLFKKELKEYINTETQDLNGNFRNEITLIKEFYYFSSTMIRESFDQNLSYLEILSEGIDQRSYQLIAQHLFSFLDSNGISYTYDTQANVIEVTNISENILNIIVNNYDIIGKVSSAKITKISPGEFGQVEREYGFSIQENNELPIIGIIDTGISDDTPLAPLIKNENNSDFNLTNTSVREDNTDHGTAVACLAALGNQLTANSENISFKADANLLSIKVLDASSAYLQRSQVIQLIRNANKVFGIRIFTLTITENHRPKNDNEEPSKYSYLLDKLAYELDILIFISIGNFNIMNLYDMFEGKLEIEYPHQFSLEDSNLESPAESYNNLTIGAIADNYEVDDSQGLTPNIYFPAIYSRTNNFNKTKSSLNQFQMNKGLFKPDLVFPGGDYNNQYEDDRGSALGLLSSKINSNAGFHRGIGTSYAAPLAANLAARIITAYPSINMQTVKAIMINSATYPWGTKSIPSDFSDLEKGINQIIGHGFPIEKTCIYSSNEEVSIIKEWKIKLEEYKVIPIKIPDYLLGKEISNVLEIKGTLCYKFHPINDNHLGYCPFHISFGVFKNVPTLKSIPTKDIKLKSTASWSEDYYYKAKLLSNVQTFRVHISKDNIKNENNQFLIAVRAKANRILPNRIQEEMKRQEHEFSLVLKIKELGKTISGNLYSELNAINNLEILSEIELEGLDGEL